MPVGLRKKDKIFRIILCQKIGQILAFMDDRLQLFKLLDEGVLMLFYVGIYVLHVIGLPSHICLECLDISYEGLLDCGDPAVGQLSEIHVRRQLWYAIQLHELLYIQYYLRIKRILNFLLVVSDHVLIYEHRPAAILQGGVGKLVLANRLIGTCDCTGQETLYRGCKQVGAYHSCASHKLVEGFLTELAIEFLLKGVPEHQRIPVKSFLLKFWKSCQSIYRQHTVLSLKQIHSSSLIRALIPVADKEATFYSSFWSSST